MDKKDKKERVIISIICLLMSIGLWFYVSNVENTIRTYDLKKVPVELLNTESLRGSNLALTPNQEIHVDLKLEGSSQIYRVDREDFKITVDISEYALKKGENKISVNIVEAPSDILIKNKNNLHIVINLEEISEKTMEITSQLEVTSQSRYFISPVEINPKEIKIRGAESLINRVESVVIRGEIKNIEENVVGVYPIIPVDASGKEVEGIELQSENADVVIKVSEGKSVPLKINTIGELGTGLKLQSIESSLKRIEIVGSKEVLDKIDEIQTTPVDLSQVKDDEEINVGIIVPDGVTILQAEEFTTIKINVIKMISKEFEVKYTLKGISEGLTIKPIKDTVTVKVTAYEDKINTIKAENIKAELNVESFKEEGTFEAVPIITLVGLDGTVSVNTTENVEFKIEKIETTPVVQVP